ncbi:fibronectin type III domain-containing protein [Flavobacterium salilacus subsp. salilacus]|uniref:fibronectin type III domain-containing protein n=1 Tax=Flavobacterium TaxID=237 RepID=UPI0010749F0E|nr:MULTISPECIES: fibronectin type III domain-containing protein [Flavobacterium]KAF2519982.1 fibronectin type III domain-containing protein [Flavobacterium salilacus subsp. salilacus]MBE1614105.1 fibronectin type III domain-containing protein [Flavobacterium sp. SaA2.13]
MKSKFLVFLVFFNVSIVFSQYLTYSPTSQTVSGESGQFITATVDIACQGASTQFASYFLGVCQDDGGFDSMNWQNGDVYGGTSVTVTFKFKKPASTTASSFTYKFKKDIGSNCKSDLISITVNYLAAECALPSPTLLAPSTTPTSCRVNWIRDPNATSYVLKYKPNNTETWYTINVTTNNSLDLNQYTFYNLQPSTTYLYTLKAKCSNGVEGPSTGLQSFRTSVCSSSAPTNLNATPWNYSYYISFTPVTGTSSYMLEWVDLVNNNNTGTTTIYYSSSPNEGNNLESIPSGHSFKFRLQTPCSGVWSDWKTIIVGDVCTASPPTTMNLTNYCSYGTGGQCGYGKFTWSSVSGADKYEVEYIIYTLTPGYNPMTGTFQATGTTYVYPTGYPLTSGGQWYAKFRMRSRCPNGSWGNFSDYTTPVPW